MKKFIKARLNLQLYKIGVQQNYILHYGEEAWGYMIYIMEKHGKALCSVYWYKDNDESLYVSNLSVAVNSRNEGLGTELFCICEKIGNFLNAESSCLMVLKDSWMYNWYSRLGYEYLNVDTYDSSYVWMKKFY